MVETDRDLHAELDRLAVRIERRIAKTRKLLDDLPEFKIGASERAKKLNNFMQRFGA